MEPGAERYTRCVWGLVTRGRYRHDSEAVFVASVSGNAVMGGSEIVFGGHECERG